MGELLEISTLGKVTVRAEGQDLTKELSRKAQALLVYLACTKRAYTRTHLAELLWFERDEKQALSNLRTLLTRLRSQLGTYLTIERDFIAFNGSQPYRLDLALVTETLSTARQNYSRHGHLTAEVIPALENSLNLYRGEFLEGFELPEALGFEEWAGLIRENLHEEITEALQRLVNYYESRGSFNAAGEWLGRLLKLDPLREEAHRTQMELLARSGQRGAALAHYKSYQRYLASELDIAPEASTTDLYEQIRLDRLNVSKRQSLAASSSGTGQPAGSVEITAKSSYLRRVSLFSEVPEEILEELATILEEVKFKAQQVIFEKGEAGQCLYIIVQGRVQVYDNRRVINDLAERDIFGEMALLEAAPRLASVKALTDTRLWRLEQEAFYRLLGTRVEIVKAIITLLSRRLRERVADLVELENRLAAMQTEASAFIPAGVS